jgi:hypothetical protein
MSSLNEISTDQLGNRVGWGGFTPHAPPPFYSRGKIFSPWRGDIVDYWYRVVVSVRQTLHQLACRYENRSRLYRPVRD